MRNLTRALTAVIALCMSAGYAPALAQEAAENEDATRRFRTSRASSTWQATHSRLTSRRRKKKRRVG